VFFQSSCPTRTARISPLHIPVRRAMRMNGRINGDLFAAAVSSSRFSSSVDSATPTSWFSSSRFTLGQS
jgi:hypothetical protein